MPRERDRLAAAFRSESRTHTRRCSLTCSPEHRRAAGGGGVCGGTGRRVGEGRVCPARVGSMTSSGHGVGGRCSCSRGVGRASSVACRGLTPAPVTAIQAVTGTGVDGGQVEGLAHTSDAPCLNCARDTGCSAIGLSPGTTPARPTTAGDGRCSRGANVARDRCPRQRRRRLKHKKCAISKHFFSGSDGTRTRDLRRDRPAL